MSIFAKTVLLAYKAIDSPGVASCYRHCPELIYRDGRQGEVICYSDDGHGALQGSSSIESWVFGGGRTIKRGGTAECSFRPLAWGARKIRRICLSPVISEILAFRPLAYICIWYKSALREWYYGEFLYDPIGGCDDAQLILTFPIALPYRESTQRTSTYLGNRILHQVHALPKKGRDFYYFSYTAQAVRMLDYPLMIWTIGASFSPNRRRFSPDVVASCLL